VSAESIVRILGQLPLTARASVMTRLRSPPRREKSSGEDGLTQMIKPRCAAPSLGASEASNLAWVARLHGFVARNLLRIQSCLIRSQQNSHRFR
jgi:hypothetical protein